jgi:hypothetical protein
MIDFPANPTLGQTFTSPNGTAWTWDGAKWTSGATGSGFLPLSGGTLTGPLTLNADPTAALQPATKEYVDGPVAALWSNIRYPNRIINGDMAVDQRHGGAAITLPAGTGYSIDRWACRGQGVGNAQQTALGQASRPPAGFPFALSWVSTAAHAVAAGDYTQFTQAIEGYNFNDANWGTASAQPVVLEFWATATQTGTFAGALQNAAQNRSYVFTYNIPVANTWTKIRISIPGDTAGTWAVASAVSAASVIFNLGAGSTYAATAGAWTAGLFLTTSGAVNVVATLNASLIITGVALMVGAAAVNAEPEFKKYSDNLIDCMRYFNTSQVAFVGYGIAANVYYASAYFQALMRVSPTFVITANNSNNFTESSMTAVTGFSGVTLLGTATATGSYTSNYKITADADF